MARWAGQTHENSGFCCTIRRRSTTAFPTTPTFRIFTTRSASRNVYEGHYERTDGSVVEGPSVSDLVAAKDPAIDKELRADLDATIGKMQAIAKGRREMARPTTSRSAKGKHVRQCAGAGRHRRAHRPDKNDRASRRGIGVGQAGRSKDRTAWIRRGAVFPVERMRTRVRGAGWSDVGARRRPSSPCRALLPDSGEETRFSLSRYQQDDRWESKRIHPLPSRERGPQDGRDPWLGPEDASGSEQDGWRA